MREEIKNILKTLGVYHPLQSSYRRALSQISKTKYRYDYRKYSGKGFCCNYCGACYSKFVPEYPDQAIKQAIEQNEVIAGFGENVYCPNCLSKNRERLVKDVMDNYIEFAGKSILHFSPEEHLYKYIKSKASVTTIDIEPGFYQHIDGDIVKGDVTKLQYVDNSFDIVVANHILEHVPDDRLAMREIHRVLKPTGVAILQTPWSKNLGATIEEPSINDPRKLAQLFGQRDHVRIYTLNDYVHRLALSGFSVKVIRPSELSMFSNHAIQEEEPVVLGYKSPPAAQG